jgi:hypothetical protein
VTVLPHRWLLRAPGNLRARLGALLKIRAPDLSNPSKPTEKELTSAKNWKILMRRNSDRPACVATRQRPKPQRSCLSCSAKPSQNPTRIRGQCLTDQSTLCYNSLTGQGTAALGWCLPASQFWTGFNLVSMVSINLGNRFYGVETGDTGESIEPEESH